MIIRIIVDESELEEVDDFLCTVFKDDNTNGLMPYFVTPLRDITNSIIGCDIAINEDAVEFLVGYDHDCHMGSEDGCQYCQMLAMLEILPEE
jgi:hypothetical protein